MGNNASNTRWSWFKDGDSSFGMFYPRHYTLAGFAGMDAADAAARELVAAGFAAGDVRSVSGRFLVEELESQEDAGLFDRIKASIAEFIGTETYFIDQDVELARKGGAFVVVYTPEESDGQRREAVLRRQRTVLARRYLAMAIERVIEPRVHDAPPREV